tara:strand:+ start:35143 stop:35556 length:414 start_codon:yes stop_codon:yes gene_type:complete
MNMMPSTPPVLWQERQFGRTVGVLLALIGVWLNWQGPRSAVGMLILVLGVLLVVLAVTYPRALVHPNRMWMGLAEVLAYVSTRVILGLVFFVVVTPIGVTKRLTGWDPLGRRRSNQESYWVPYSERQHDRKHFEKMF